MSLGERLQHAWNAFRSNGSTKSLDYMSYGYGYASRPDLLRLRSGMERTLIASLYNRIAIDVAAVTINHVRLDENGRFTSIIDSSLNRCLTKDANIDQTGRALIQDVVMSLCDTGFCAVVPVKTTLDPMKTEGYQIEELRVGDIIEWYPSDVKVKVYNEEIGDRQEVILPKRMVAVITNPLYSVMNEPNSTLRRLINKLNLLDVMDEKNSSGKMDLIIQLPYLAKSPMRKAQAEQRRKEVEDQLIGSKYGIAYIDGTEHITQLNRPAENNLLTQIEYLTKQLYVQLGLTEEVFNGTADEKTMLNYHNRTIEPFLSAITTEMDRKFLSKTAQTQGQAIRFFSDSFKLVPVEQLAEIADKFTRNEILSPNEIRSIIGYKPVADPRADELRNRNLNQNNNDENPVEPVMTNDSEEGGEA